MNNDDGWDWPWLYYAGTVLLRMTENEFWHCLPKKLKVLTDVYVRMNSSDESKNDTKQGYIDQVL